MRDQVFISYSHKDKDWLDRLQTTLKPLVRNGALTVWADTQIRAGDKWKEEIEAALSRAKIAVLLVSQDFLASDFIANEELPPLLEAAEKEGLTIFWVPVTASLYEETDIAKYQAAHDPNAPLDGLAEPELNVALVAIGKKIQEISSLQQEPPKASNLGKNYDPPESISIAHLPTTPQHFVGREKELKQLDEVWDNEKTNIISLVAFGGVGKSALVAEWLQKLSQENYRGARYVLGHSFYSQGSHEDAQVSSDGFVDEALRFFGDEDPTAGSPWDKGERLAQLVRESRTLLVLDGLEPLQHPPTSGDAGRIKDPALQALVRELAASNPGLCVITTRQTVADILGTLTIDLEHLSDQAGAELLRALGVKGLQEELEHAAQYVKGHGLALTLLGTYLSKAYDGDVRQINEIELVKADDRQGGHARKLMEKYERWLGDGPELSILQLLGLFDRPAEAGSIQALRTEPAIPNLTDSLVDLGQEDWRFAVSNLRDCGLVSPASSGDSNSQSLDAHPLVREHFAEQLTERFPKAAKEAHRRLYEHLKQSTPEQPDTLQAMMPLYHAVAHGCKAELWQEALDEVYFERINRGQEFFSTQKLGAFGADLSAVSCFFDEPWQRSTTNVTEADQAWILGQAGFRLRALRRLGEAAEPLKASIEAYIAQQEWKNSAQAVANLSELHLTLGDLAASIRMAEQSVELADRSGDAFLRMVGRGTLADALHQAARNAKSLAAFREAEGMQKERQPEAPLLYSLAGFRYCDLLLDEPSAFSPQLLALNVEPKDVDTAQSAIETCHNVRNHAEYALELSEQFLGKGLGLHDIALDHLTLGRTHFLEVLLQAATTIPQPAMEQTEQHLNESVSFLRQAGQQHELPRGLLARAALRRVQERFDDAERNIAEAESIAERGSMLIHQIDAAIERCRLQLAMGKRGTARESLELAKELVKKTEQPYEPHIPDWDEWEPPDYVGGFKKGEIVGYHRRNPEIAALEEVLGVKA